MMRRLAISALLIGVIASSAVAQQAPPVVGAQSPGARAGNSYVPSTHSPGCGGIMCDGNDPALRAGPPPPCAGLICGMTPYAMQPPMTASEAARINEQRARAEAAAPPPPPPEAKPMKKRHTARKAHKAAPKATAARTPDPAAAPAR